MDKNDASDDYIGMNQNYLERNKDDHVIFDSDFESGNLDLVFEYTNNEYDLYLRIDSNTKGHT